MSGHKIIDGLKDAIAGNFTRITIEGQTWVRVDQAPPVFAENARLRAALKPFADYAATLGPEFPDTARIGYAPAITRPNHHPTVGDLRHARAITEQKAKP